MKKLFLIFLITVTLFGEIKILDRVNLDGKYFKNYNFSEISDLAYDKKHKILYMISDKGMLFSFRANFSDNKIHLQALSANYLRKKNGKRLRGRKKDSEGLTLDNKNHLFVSFERKPRVYEISKDGMLLRKVKIKLLKKYEQRSPNKSLEALAFHPKYGFLTAYEYAPKGFEKCNQLIFASSGKIFPIKLEKFKNCAITALEVINKKNLLVLERAYGGIFGEFAITLLKYNLKSHETEILWQIKRSNENEVQNFEGLTKIDKNRFLMVSDDNKNFLLKSELILFEIR